MHFPVNAVTVITVVMIFHHAQLWQRRMNSNMRYNTMYEIAQSAILHKASDHHNESTCQTHIVCCILYNLPGSHRIVCCILCSLPGRHSLLTLKIQMHHWQEECCRNAVFCYISWCFFLFFCSLFFKFKLQTYSVLKPYSVYSILNKWLIIILLNWNCRISRLILVILPFLRWLTKSRRMFTSTACWSFATKEKSQERDTWKSANGLARWTPHSTGIPDLQIWMSSESQMMRRKDAQV